MIRAPRMIPRRFYLPWLSRNLNPPQSSALINPILPFSTTRRISVDRRRRRRNKISGIPLPPDHSFLSSVMASLPPRFTFTDLSSAIARLPDPRLSFPLLHSAFILRPILLRSGDSAAYSPFFSAVKRLGTAGLYQEMDSIASLAFSFSSLPLPETFFNALIRFYSDARWISKAIGVYKIMRSSGSSVRPTVRTFNLLFAAVMGHRGANSYIHHLYMDAIRSIFRQMVGSGVAPDVHSLNAMIKGYVLSLHVNDALRIFHQMVPIYGVEPNDHTYSYLLHGLCSQGRTQNAAEIYAVMREKGLVPTTRAWNSLVNALAMAGDVEDAVSVMWEGVRLRQGPDFITCRTILDEICRKKGVAEAAELLKELKKKKVVDGQCCRELFMGLRDEHRD